MNCHFITINSLCLLLLWTESAYNRHEISQHKADQRHQCSRQQDIRHEDHPYHILDGDARQDGHYDAGDAEDAEASLSTKRRHVTLRNADVHYVYATHISVSPL